MKKLMIAAAAAAMIANVEAAAPKGNLAYRFNACLTTTRSEGQVLTTEGTPGSSSTQAFNLQAGVDKAGKVFWYDDPTIKGYDRSKFKNLAWDTANKGTDFAHPTLVIGGDGSVNADEHKFLTLPEWKNYGVENGERCLDISWIVVKTTPGTPGTTKPICYRVPGCEEIETDVYIPTNCCTANVKQFATADATGIIDFGTAPGFMYYFGAPVKEDARNVEIFAGVNGMKTKTYETWDTIADKDVLRGGRTLTAVLAGQGWADDYETGRRPSNISGNIVGYLGPSKCGCCLPTLPSDLAFDPCTGADQKNVNTAAYGWFCLQYLGITE